MLLIIKLISILALGLLWSGNAIAHHPGYEPTKLWLLCHNIMHYLGEITGLGYAGANVVLFIFIQPALIVLFMTLWLIEKFK